MPYRSPFITETDEPTFTDCQFAAGLSSSPSGPLVRPSTTATATRSTRWA